MALTISAFGQSLVEPERVAAMRQAFEAAVSAPRLRCQISPVRPALSFGFRFQNGYTIDTPLAQFLGSGHGLTVHTRVTAEGREPVYLTQTEALPAVPETKLEVETAGTFVVGEGKYGLEVLVEDDLHRFCRGAWQIQARRTGSERQLKPTTPPGAVEELSAGGPLLPDPKSPRLDFSSKRIARLTILVHAAPLSPNLSQLQPTDVQRLVDSLSSLLRELPAQKTRLIAFNLDQRAVIFRTEGFEANQMDELTAALNHLELGLVDYRTLRERPEPIDLLLGLVQAELRDPKPPDALIVLGPRTRMLDDVPAVAVGKRPAVGPPIFGLQYRFNRPLVPGQGPYSGGSLGPVPSRPGPLRAGGERLPGKLQPPAAVDTIERLVSRLKGQTIPIRTPHDLADAIQIMNSRILIVNSIPPRN